MTIITGKAKIAGVAGWPIEHSRSPLLHNFWLSRYGIDGAYIPLPIRPEEFQTAIRGLVAAGFKGCNVTIPHKEAAFACCDRVDAIARKTGSVNTLVFQENGEIFGTSTDGAGFVASLKQEKLVLQGRKILVLGAGGASRSVVFSLAEENAKITIANRTMAKAEKLVADLGRGDVMAWDQWENHLDQFDILVNTTSLGMEGKIKENSVPHFNLSKARQDLVVTDIVYVPRKTPLLQAAQQRGLKTIEGLGMLLHQACLGFNYWFGVYPEVDHEVTEFIAASLKA